VSYDVIVIGGGTNGLVTAARLGQAGRRVIVLEQAAWLGGLAARRKLGDGYLVPGVLHDTDAFRASVVDALRLKDHGLVVDDGEPKVMSPEVDGPGLWLSRRAKDARAELAACAPDDVEAYTRWRAFVDRVRGFLSDLLDEPAPILGGEKKPSGLWEVAKRGFALRRLGKQDMTDLLRVLPMSAADWLGEYFKSQRLRAMLAAPAIWGTFGGPHSGGTTANLLFHEATSSGAGVKGGPAAVVDALVAACKAHGVELRTGATVQRILVEGGRVEGVRLASGDLVNAKLVAASCDPRQTMLELLPASASSLRLESQFRAIRSRGTTAKLHLALSAPLELPERPGERIERLRTGAHVDELERAHDAVKYGRISDEPHLDVRVFHEGCAPAGHAVASVAVHFAPHALRGGWSDEARAEVGRRARDVLRRYVPDLDERVVAEEVLSPADLESELRLTGGCVHHVEHALDQLLFMRPAPLAVRYATPIDGLYLAGSGCHPGGGVTGAPGHLAAQTILAAG
jgi:phytoene dehydrogenase-like protein